MALKNKNLEITDVKSIVVIMFGLLGDVFIRTPVLKALKELYPDAVITAVVDSIGEKVLKNNEFCDDIIIVDRSKKNKLSYYANKIKTIVNVRKKHADLIVDLYNGGSSPFIVLTSSAKYRLGYKHQKENFAYNLKSDYVPYENGHIDSYNKQVISILKPISNKLFSLRQIFNISKNSQEKMKEYLNGSNENLENVYVLNLGSGGEEKLLDNKVYYQAVKYIYEKYNFIPAIVQNPSQEYLQEGLIKDYLDDAKVKYIKLKSLSIDEIAEVIKLSRFIITPDTGLMHLAFALDAYVFTAFTYTNPKLVDIGSDKFITVFNKFEHGVLHKKQNITFEMIVEKMDILFERLS